MTCRRRRYCRTHKDGADKLSRTEDTGVCMSKGLPMVAEWGKQCKASDNIHCIDKSYMNSNQEEADTAAARC